MKRNSAYIHVVYEVQLLFGERAWRRKMGKKLCEIVGVRAFRRWVIAYYRRHQESFERGRGLIFFLQGSRNKRRYHILKLQQESSGWQIYAGPVKGPTNFGRYGPLHYSHSPARCKRPHKGGALCSSAF